MVIWMSCVQIANGKVQGKDWTTSVEYLPS